MAKEKEKQCIRVKIDVIVEFDAKYDEKELHDMVERNGMRAFPTNARRFNSIQWTPKGKKAKWKKVTF